MARLKETYQNEIVNAMMKKFGYKNIMEVPKLEKIVINMGVGEAKENAKVLDAAVKELETITGQHVVTTKAWYLPLPSSGRLMLKMHEMCISDCMRCTSRAT